MYVLRRNVNRKETIVTLMWAAILVFCLGVLVWWALPNSDVKPWIGPVIMGVLGIMGPEANNSVIGITSWVVIPVAIAAKVLIVVSCIS